MSPLRLFENQRKNDGLGIQAQQDWEHIKTWQGDKPIDSFNMHGELISKLMVWLSEIVEPLTYLLSLNNDQSIGTKSPESLFLVQTILIDIPELVETLAKLPSREVLLAQVVGGLQSPIYGLVNVLAGPIRGVMGVLQARIRQLEGA